MTKSTPFDDLDDYLALPRVSGLAVSPDGSRVVTTVAELNDKRTEFVSAIWEVDPAGRQPARRLTRGAKGESSPVFTADGDLLVRCGQADRRRRQAARRVVAVARRRRRGGRGTGAARWCRRCPHRAQRHRPLWSPPTCCGRRRTSTRTNGCGRCARTTRCRRCCTPAIRCGTGITTSAPITRICSTPTDHGI